MERASTALLLACIGIYGALAEAVVQRRRELGVRMALGATQGQLAGAIVRKGLGLTLAGMAMGLALAAALR